jgi:hypothetical protein
VANDGPSMPHPRARALRVGLALTSLSLVAISCIVAAMARDVAAGFTTIALCSLGMVASVLVSSHEHLPRGAPLSRRERNILICGLLVSPIAAIGLLIAVASGVVSGWTLAVPGGLAVGAGVYALVLALG